jgi:hypothetical protein
MDEAMPENHYQTPTEVGTPRAGRRWKGCLAAAIAAAAPLVGLILGLLAGSFVAGVVFQYETSQLAPGEELRSDRSVHADFGIIAGLVVWGVVALSMLILAWFVWRRSGMRR